MTVVGLPKRIATTLLLFAGVLLVHALAYLIAHPDPLVRAVSLEGHRYLEIAGALIGPAIAVAIAVVAVQRARDQQISGWLTPWRYTVGVSVAFLTVEVLERIPDGTIGTVMTEPAIRVGLLLVVPVSWLIFRFVASTAEVVASLFFGRVTKPAHSQHRPWPVSEEVHSRAIYRYAPISRRGPPWSTASV